MTRYGLIAGSGRFPILALEAARKLGHEVVAVGIQEEASPEIEALCARCHWISLGELSRLIEILKQESTCCTKSQPAPSRETNPMTSSRTLSVWLDRWPQFASVLLRAMRCLNPPEAIKTICCFSKIAAALAPGNFAG